MFILPFFGSYDWVYDSLQQIVKKIILTSFLGFGLYYIYNLKAIFCRTLPQNHISNIEGNMNIFYPKFSLTIDFFKNDSIQILFEYCKGTINLVIILGNLMKGVMLTDQKKTLKEEWMNKCEISPLGFYSIEEINERLYS